GGTYVADSDPLKINQNNIEFVLNNEGKFVNTSDNTTEIANLKFVTTEVKHNLPASISPANSADSIVFDITDASNNILYTVTTAPWNSSASPKSFAVEADASNNIEDADYQIFLKNIIDLLSQYLANQIDPNAFYSEGVNITDDAKNAYLEYKKESIELIKLIFGEGTATTDGNGAYAPFKEFTTNYGFTIKAEDLRNLSNTDWIRAEYKALTDKYKPGGTSPDTSKYAALKTAQAKFQPVLDVDIIDKIFNTYGEPVYAWIDKDDKENGEKKAEWYTNLFNRMKEGYQVLEDGLAASPQWIKYALESGLVVMEQVDKNKVWNKFTYSNCSDITEQTDQLAVTKAEAEYKRSMNKIETKDKQYDLELKNIDTEHNSLQTEYDSIKAAIDKNIERNFKMYS
ncbi:MAG: hypothetical protein LBJ74_05860, partial [Heliobacteriaceae bacterium]|nr:hypothetical protein [Heliobacteriaceae bacterium]